jgi:hypothetical protein
MGRKVWSADELARLSPAEQDALFDESIVTDLDEVPTEFLSRIRDRFEQRTRMNAPRQPE